VCVHVWLRVCVCVCVCACVHVWLRVRVRARLVCSVGTTCVIGMGKVVP
jgi:hypothetical protein